MSIEESLNSDGTPNQGNPHVSDGPDGRMPLKIPLDRIDEIEKEIGIMIGRRKNDEVTKRLIDLVFPQKQTPEFPQEQKPRYKSPVKKLIESLRFRRLIKS